MEAWYIYTWNHKPVCVNMVYHPGEKYIINGSYIFKPFNEMWGKEVRGFPWGKV